MKNVISDIEIYEREPQGFSPQVQVSACYLEMDGKLLLLQRIAGKSEPEKWGVPAGKLEGAETPEDGAKRELFEETGISLEYPSQMQRLGSLYIRKPGVDYIYHLFKVQLKEMPQIQLSDEHQNYHWATSRDLEEMPLMAGAMKTVEYYRTAPPRKRSGASVNAYLILKKERQILLHLRKNTGYCDGMWSLVAGHVEDGESATAAMIREAREEIGLDLASMPLKVVHAMHRRTNRFNIDLFFDCPIWHGTIQNCEPEKCERLEFFPLDALPANIVDYNAIALKCISRGEFYSEAGW